MSTELILYFNNNDEIGVGPATVDTAVFSTPAITYSGGVYSMTLSPLKLADVEYYINSASPSHIVSKNGLLSVSDIITVSADATDITAAVGGATSNFSAFLLRWVISGVVYYYTCYVKESDRATLEAYLADTSVRQYLTCEAIVENVFTAPVTPPNDYTYVATELDIYTFNGYWLQTSPAMSVYKNGSLLTVTTDYTIELYETGTQGETVKIQIKMTATPTATDVISATYTWRHDCSAVENVSVYEFDKESNTSIGKDVNGRNIIKEAYEKYTGFVGRLVWPYATYRFWDTIRTASETAGCTIDVVRVSLAGYQVGTIYDLYIKNYTKWNEEPQTVGYMKDLEIDVVKA